MSLDAEHTYLTKTGNVLVTGDGQILVQGFDGEQCTCRDVVALALVWAIGILQKELLATIEKPGAGIAVVE